MLGCDRLIALTLPGSQNWACRSTNVPGSADAGLTQVLLAMCGVGTRSCDADDNGRSTDRDCAVPP